MKVEVYLAINGEAQPSRAGDILLEFPLSNLYTASMRWVDPQAQCGLVKVRRIELRSGTVHFGFGAPSTPFHPHKYAQIHVLTIHLDINRITELYSRL